MNANANAGVAIKQSGTDVTITITSTGTNVDKVQYKHIDNSGDSDGTSFTDIGGAAGDSTTRSGVDTDDDIIIRATGSGDAQTTVIRTYTAI